MMRYVLAAFLLVHGLIHAAWLSPSPPAGDGPPWPFDLTRSRLLSALRAPEAAFRPVGFALIAVTIAGFAVSALGAAGVVGLGAAWGAMTIAASLSSAGLIVAFWHPYFPVGLALDAALVVTTLAGWWPSMLVR